MSDPKFDSKFEEKLTQTYGNLQNDSQKVDTMQALRKIADAKDNKKLGMTLAFCSVLAVLGLAASALVLSNSDEGSQTDVAAQRDVDEEPPTESAQEDPEVDEEDPVATVVDGPDSSAAPTDSVVDEGAPVVTTEESVRECSASGMSPQAVGAATVAATETVNKIVQAAVECDWDALKALAAPNFVASFDPGPDPIEDWRKAEEGIVGSPGILRTLVTVAQTSSRADVETGEQFWPSFFGGQVCQRWLDGELDAATLADMEKLNFDPAESCEDDLGYLGYRLGITGNGDWIFFIAGD